MSFVDIQFPDQISAGSRGGPDFGDRIIMNDSRQPTIVQPHSAPLYYFNVREGIQKLDDLDAIHEHFLAVGGAGNSFPFKFPKYYASTANHRVTETVSVDDGDQVLVPDDGTRTRYQLRKKWTYGGTDYYQTIRRPVSGTVVVAYDTVNTTAFTVDATGGIIPDSDPGASTVVTAGFEFNFEVRYSNEAGRALLFEMQSGAGGRVSNDIILFEQKDTRLFPSRRYGGGSKEWGTIAETIYLSTSEGQFQFWVDDTDEDVILPDPEAEGIPSGDRIFTLKNDGGTGTSVIKSHTGTTVKSLADADNGVEIALHLNLSTGVYTWKAAS